MPLISSIQRNIVEAPDFQERESDIVISVPLSDKQVITFTAETQFFPPRQIATNRADVLGLPSQSVVEYTANSVPVVKMPIGDVDITTPQFYPVSVVSDVYQDVPIDKFFRELVDDFELDEDPTLLSAQDRRLAAMRAAMALDDLIAANSVGDLDALEEANDMLEDELASAIEDPEIDPASIITPEEEDELAALDFVGLTDDYGSTDGSDDVIDPTPEIIEDDLIQRLPKVSGKVTGTETINQAINLLNKGIQQVEDSTQTGTDDNGECKVITIAKKKKGFLGIGKKKERKVKRADIKQKLEKVNSELEKQKAQDAPIPGYYKKKQKTGLFAKAFGVVAQGLAKAGPLGTLLGSVIAAPFTGGASLALLAGGTAALGVASALESVAISAGTKVGIVPKNTVPMNKREIQVTLEKTKEKLEQILDKKGDC